MKKRIHLICNAHLDPVWLWEREEGMAEAISTFRVAADLCEEFGSFVFNHNEVILYQWVEDFDPALFKRIQRLVKQGRWHIMGGWYLQPDCNLPSGESFVRQMLVGRRYFAEKFGARPTTAINFDPFGHSRGLVQLMSKAGFDNYLFCRPSQGDCPLPNHEFLWVGHDGSTVMGSRSLDWYLSQRGTARAKIETRMKDFPDRDFCYLLWGIGNHGGGPSVEDLTDITALIAEEVDGEFEIIHSTPEAYQAELTQHRDTLPRYEGSLNAWAPGCYTSQIRIKQKHRQLENQLYLTEKMCSHAFLAGGFDYPVAELDDAEEDLLFAEFHDILPGSSIQPVEESALNMMGHGLEILKRERARAFFALASGQPAGKPGEIPVLVYNPHPFPVETTVECEFILPDQNWGGGFTDFTAEQGRKTVPVQVEREASNVPVDWRKRVAIQAILEPMAMNRFDLTPVVRKKKPAPRLKVRDGALRFRSDDVTVVINARTGLLDRYRVDGRDLLGAKACRPIVIDDYEDPWGSSVQAFRELEGGFKLLSAKRAAEVSGFKGRLDPVRVIEDGAVRTVVEAMLGWKDSVLILRYLLPKRGSEVGLEVRVLWNEKDKFLKLSLPVKGGEELFGQVACGVDSLRTDGNECVAQKWMAVTTAEGDALSVVNDGIYACDFRNGELRLSLLRSPAYSALSIDRPGEVMDKNTLAHDRFSPRSDQGERLFRFWLNGGNRAARFKA
ncbi:MAG: glycoside hydrolase family 38 N-terminal domain-containing protein, partial [Planctomycetota bacterium]